MHPDIIKIYGNKIRIRACGLCWRNDKLLMVNHSGLGSEDLWIPPGGGVAFNQTVTETLIREFAEETGITINVGQFKFICEYLKPPLHAIEMFFDAIYVSGEVATGFDPEMKSDRQIIKTARWMTTAEILSLPKSELHGVFKICANPKDLKDLSGFWQI